MPIGEGAGYAGGIASAALEGFRAAKLNNFRPTVVTSCIYRKFPLIRLQFL